PATKAYLDGLVRMNDYQPISGVEFIDVRQSMRNGGGPACLRLRVVLSEVERKAVAGNVLLDDALYKRLTAWATKHHRERIEPRDLADPELMEESFTALDALTGILGLGPIYEFQL
ncbi:MAG TPA: N-succinylarginine dihydrolase, partial [Sphingomonadales bacterium]|nr:N-succinylarginine dihydrolase [Sphingomonadales bacterium]